MVARLGAPLELKHARVRFRVGSGVRQHASV
jgi:hypothetical protein